MRATLPLLVTVFLASQASAATPAAGVDLQQKKGAVWTVDLKGGLEQARDEGRSVVLVFTAGDACPSCSALSTEVFGKGTWSADHARRFVPVKVGFCGNNRPDDQVLIATARLQVFPTVYLLDADGWPYHVQRGFKPGDGADVLEGLLEARDRRTRPERWRALGRPGYRKLLAWYRERKLPFGETLALAALFPKASLKERLEWAPSLLAVETARAGKLPKKPHLALLVKHDRDGARGHLANGLLLAGRQLLGLGKKRAALDVYKRALDLRKASPGLRTEAAVYVAHVYTRLAAPCLARKQLAQAVVNWGQEKDAATVKWINYARARLDGIEPCSKNACRCPKLK